MAIGGDLVDLHCYESMSSLSTSAWDDDDDDDDDGSVLSTFSPVREWYAAREDARWCIATYHLRREIGLRSSRERLWILALFSVSRVAARFVETILSGLKDSNRFDEIHRRIRFATPLDESGRPTWTSANFDQGRFRESLLRRVRDPLE